MDLRSLLKFRLWIALVVLFTLQGCRDSGGRYRVHGKVQYKGQPVPFGRVLFEPDGSKGNRGPQGFAIIKDGVFDTHDNGCKGAVGGPHVVRIDGFDGKSVSDDAPFGSPIFSQYEDTIDLPKEGTEVDFEVPTTRRKGK